MFHLRWVTGWHNWKKLKCNTCVVVVSEVQRGKTQRGMWSFVAFKFMQNSTFCLTACIQCTTLNAWICWEYSVGNTLMIGCAGFRDDITSMISVQIMSQSRSQYWKLPKKSKCCRAGAGSCSGLRIISTQNRPNATGFLTLSQRWERLLHHDWQYYPVHKSERSQTLL